MQIQLVTDAPLKYFIVDDFLPKDLAEEMIDEVVRLRSTMKPGRMRIQKQGKFVKEFKAIIRRTSTASSIRSTSRSETSRPSSAISTDCFSRSLWSQRFANPEICCSAICFFDQTSIRLTWRRTATGTTTKSTSICRRAS